MKRNRKKKTVWVSALVPRKGADIYGGVRIVTSPTMNEAYDDLADWLDLLPGPPFYVTAMLDASPEVLSWSIEEREV